MREKRKQVKEGSTADTMGHITELAIASQETLSGPADALKTVWHYCYLESFIGERLG